MLNSQVRDLQLRFRFKTDATGDAPGGYAMEPRYNIAPAQNIPVILAPEGEPVLAEMSWGLVPGWMKDEDGGPKPINAKAETLTENGMFRGALSKRRCLIPANGFYEWRKVGDKKQPYFVHLKTNEPFAFAGLWEERREENGNLLHSCAIITTDANTLMREIHPRMPVMLLPEDEPIWLHISNKGRDVVDLLLPYPNEPMEAYPISTLVNAPTRDSPNLINPL